jgi:hypothetical protein
MENVGYECEQVVPTSSRGSRSLEKVVFSTLQWGRPWSIENIPMNMAILFNSTSLLSKLLPFKSDFFYKEPSDLVYGIDRPLQVAAFLERT